MARKTKQEAQETRQHILDVALRLFSQQGVSSTSLGEIAKAAGVTRGAIYWHFKDKSDLFSEIWELSESNIGELELEYQAKFPGDPLSVLREILIHVLESTVTEERRRLLMEIIFHKCEFVGEMAVVQQAQRNLCLESYDRIEQTLKHCIEAKMLPADLMTRRAAIIGIRSQRPLRTIWSLKGVFQQLCMSSTSGKNRQSPKHRRNFRLEIDHRILHSF